jgi:hypothetical protein
MSTKKLYSVSHRAGTDCPAPMGAVRIRWIDVSNEDAVTQLARREQATMGICAVVLALDVGNFRSGTAEDHIEEGRIGRSQ